MPLFTTPREKQLWFWTSLVIVAIFSILIIGQPLENIFRNQNVQAVIFFTGMLLVGVSVFIHGFQLKYNKLEIAIWIGIIGVYLMLFLRLSLPERSHLIEYSVLAIFIHMALVERFKSKNNIWVPAILAFVLTFLIGLIDESIQIFLPHRVFDPIDVLFNTLAGFMAILVSVFFFWIRNRKKK